MRNLQKYFLTSLATFAIPLFIYFFLKSKNAVNRRKVSPQDVTYPYINIQPTEVAVAKVNSSRQFNKSQAHLLIIFTTFKKEPHSAHHSQAHKLAVINWASFGASLVKPVLFTDDQLPTSVDDKSNKAELGLAELALLNGWDILPIPSKSGENLPHLKPMFLKVFQRYEATFYGYSNGDILFDNSLIHTLTFTKDALHTNLDNNVLLVGRRWDVPIRLKGAPITNKFFNASSDSQSTRFKTSGLASLSVTEGTLREPYAVDYFFFTKNSTFHWPTFRNVVVSRRGYDNYLIAFANQSKVNTIDCTKTLLAVHVSKPGVRDSSKYGNHTDINIDEIGHKFPYQFGHTTNTIYCLEHVDSSEILMSKRTSENC